MKKLILLFTLAAVAYSACSQSKPAVIPLYEGKIPNEVPGPNQEKMEVREGNVEITSLVRQPTLTVYLPAKGKANGTAVVICPGGGYWILAAGHEGADVARKFAANGVTAFVLKYRLPDPAITSQPEITPLQDAQQALYLVRKKAKEYNINPEQVGMMGFSAGGHLASTAGTHYTKSQIPNPENLSLRPDFLLLIYPVISSDTAIWHQGSFDRLLGKGASKQKMQAYSNEQQVTAQTPPTFLVHASDDDLVPVQNSVVFYQALLQHKVPAELHVYQRGGHGFGMVNKTTKDLWFDRCLNWMGSNQLLVPAKPAPQGK
ncbi:alpha/beta hydrolase [Rufibacter sediminis]|uniref:Alpha/beta hydrolase n=1 Tax=Rufibacter sediminis TaxID=2762756 RepID=A0ABR6VUY6_9BACT|nr:alpha/beta hydrolase [Rufibacter sediminis]MBC3541022.1 alpha/beta hydrolase [Rufibacter sediminis]